jgi:hypothetical protein
MSLQWTKWSVLSATVLMAASVAFGQSASTDTQRTGER